MGKRLIAILIILNVSSGLLFPQGPDNDSLLKAIIYKNGQAAVSLPLPSASETDIITRHVSVVSLRAKQLEISLSPLTVDWFISRGYNYKILDEDNSKGIETASVLKEAMAWDRYPTYAQYDSMMQSFAALYPALCDLDTIGATNYGKYVFVLKISDAPYIDEDEPETFYSSSIHGDETGGFILMLRLIDYILKSYPSDSRIRNLVDSQEIWINPLANPDGTYRTGNTISSPVRGNSNGYDLNRNFPDPVDDEPVKQKETLDMIRFMRARNFVLSANFHAGEEVVNYPWDRWERRHPDEDWFYQISRKYADTVHKNSVSGYMTFLENGVTNGYDWYYIYGGRQDYMTWERGGREVTIELDDIKVTPAGNLNALWDYNWRSLIGYLENALYGIHGKVTDATTGDPVAAKVFIPGHDADSSHVYADSVTGYFVRLIAPGTWTLKFSAVGYEVKTVTITVVDGAVTWRNVELTPVSNPVDTISDRVLHIYPNPVNEQISVILPERQIGTVRIAIYDIKGVRVKGTGNSTEHTFEDIPLIINVQDLVPGLYTLVITNSETGIKDKARFVVVHTNY